MEFHFPTDTTEKPRPVIVLIEDNPDDVELTLRELKRLVDAVVIVLDDGQAALDFLFNNARPASLVILDMHLPKVDGLTVLERMSADPRTHRIPVLLFTASDLQQKRWAAQSCPGNGFLRKPLNSDVFVETLQKLGLHSLLTKSPEPSQPDPNGF